MNTTWLAALPSALKEHGAVVVPGLLPEQLRRQIVRWFDEEVRPHTGALPRPLTAQPEAHRFSSDGWMVNPVANLHALPWENISQTELRVMQASPVVAMAQTCLGHAPRLLQSAYWESSEGTLPHIDVHPLDYTSPMIGVWIALEDVEESAGRFYWYAGSQLYTADLRECLVADYVATIQQGKPDPDRTAGALEAVLAVVHERALPVMQPALRAGDCIVWRDDVLHGSSIPAPGGGTRRSVLLHFC